MVEVTEHVEVLSYAAVRAAIHRCPGVRIAADDADAGYAGLRHILGLKPDFVKLDVGLVRYIDSDPARQALAAGLRHHIEPTGTALIAEGVKTAGGTGCAGVPADPTGPRLPVRTAGPGGRCGGTSWSGSHPRGRTR